MEFDEVRPYMPGDDIRSLDWRVTARTGRAHTKLFREERERPVLLAIDLRESMFFATRGTFKSVLAVKLAALLAWSANQNGDRVGGQIFNDVEYRESKPQSGKQTVLHLLKQLVDLSDPARFHDHAGSRGTMTGESLADALFRLYRHSKPGTLVVIVSDFRFFNGACETHLMRLSRHCDVFLLMVHDGLEAQLPPKGIYRFSDGERNVSVNTDNEKTIEIYRQGFVSHTENLKNLALRYGMRFFKAVTTDDPLEILRSAALKGRVSI